MAKFHLKKKSKRQPARLRYKIEKKIRDHNRKVKKESKKNPQKNKRTVIEVPNICPFKENILKEVEVMKKQKEEERIRQREAAMVEKKAQKEAEVKKRNAAGYEGLVANVEKKNNLSEYLSLNDPDKIYNSKSKNSLKQYYKEFNKVIDAADVILEVVDARDPLGTRCIQVEQAVREQANKRLVIVLNKADLVPRAILDKWLKFLRKSVPAVAFKASTQMQSKKLGQKKFSKINKVLQSSVCIGATLLMSLLANYCRNKGIKTSIRVGVVGLPNVGKSSIINSLKRSRACSVGATPGVTKAMQEVQLDSKIKLLDSPGIVFASGNDTNASLRNAIRISSLSDPVTPANAILQRVSKQQMMEIYDIGDYSTPDEFYSVKAKRYGKYKKGGIPDSMAAARGLLEDWNSGKIKYYTVPPEESEDKAYISSAIVTEMAKEFDLDNFQTMETDDFNKFEKEASKKSNMFVLDSLGPVGAIEKMEEDCTEGKQLLGDNINVATVQKRRKGKNEILVKRIDPEMQLEGNQKLNQIKKKQFKKEKKQKKRKERVVQQLAAGVENFTLNANKRKLDDDYNFEKDFILN